MAKVISSPSSNGEALDILVSLLEYGSGTGLRLVPLTLIMSLLEVRKFEDGGGGGGVGVGPPGGGGLPGGGVGDGGGGGGKTGGGGVTGGGGLPGGGVYEA